MDKAITTALMIIASIAATLALINAVIPAMGKSSGALLTANSDAADRIRTDIDIIHATGNSSDDVIKLWVKNVGSQPVQPIEASDVFLQTATDAQRLGWNGSAAVGCNCWRYEIENGSAWTQTVTVQFIVFPASVDSGSYRATVTVANGVSALGVSALKDFSVQ